MIKIGIIGASPLLKTHAAYLKTSEKIEVVGLMNTGEREVDTSFFQGTPKPVSNVEQLIHESDCIFITGNCQEYFDVAVMALKSSKHLFLNDLSGLPVNQAMRLTKLASEADSIIYPSQLLRFNKAALEARQYLSKPLFIDLEHRQTRCSSWSNEKNLHRALMEEVSLILSFVSSGVKKVNTASTKIFGDFPDLIDARLEFNNGCVAVLRMNCLTTEDKHQLTIFQEGKFIGVNLKYPSLSIFSQKEGDKIIEEKKTDLPDKMDEGRHELDYFLDLADSKQKIRIDNEEDLQAFFITDEIMSRLQRNGFT
jgi:predicted dehydrogenase